MRGPNAWSAALVGVHDARAGSDRERRRWTTTAPAKPSYRSACRRSCPPPSVGCLDVTPRLLNRPISNPRSRSALPTSSIRSRIAGCGQPASGPPGEALRTCPAPIAVGDPLLVMTATLLRRSREKTSRGRYFQHSISSVKALARSPISAGESGLLEEAVA